MKAYDKEILNELLDKYERSSVFKETNVRAVPITFQFTKKTVPAYFDENSLAYEEIEQQMIELAHHGLINIHWKDKLSQNIILKVELNQEKLEEAYAFVNRKKQKDILEDCMNFLKAYPYQTKTGQDFGTYVLEKMSRGESVKKYISLDNLSETKEILDGLERIAANDKECYIRELSMLLYGDSKRLESLSSKLCMILAEFSEYAKSPDLLSEYNVMRTPSYVMMKGEGEVFLKGSRIALSDLSQGIGINSVDLSLLEFDLQKVTTIFTIENLTAFYRFHRENALIIYLGGYHNKARRAMLKTIAKKAPFAEFYHWGDIDAGGFLIYKDLCEKTGLPFLPYRMDIPTLNEFFKYTKKLTENDKTTLNRLLSDEFFAKWQEVIQYMLKHEVKLEQEIVAFQKDL